MSKIEKVPCVFDEGEWKRFLDRVQKMVWKSQVGSTWKELADKAGLSVATVANFASGKTKQPGLMTVWKLCNALGIKMKFFEAEKVDPMNLIRFDAMRHPRNIDRRGSATVGELKKAA